MRNTTSRRLLILVPNKVFLTLPLENGLHTSVIKLLKTLALFHVLNLDPFTILWGVDCVVGITGRDINSINGGPLLIKQRLFWVFIIVVRFDLYALFSKVICTSEDALGLHGRIFHPFKSNYFWPLVDSDRLNSEKVHRRDHLTTILGVRCRVHGFNSGKQGVVVHRALVYGVL